MVGLMLSGCPRVAKSPINPAVPRAQGGVSLGLFASEPNYDYEPLLKEMVGHKAQRVQLVIPYYLDDVQSHNMQLLPGFSPSVQNIHRTLQQAKAMGFGIQILPILRLKKRTAEQWRGVLRPSAGNQRFFDAYEEVLLPLAQLAAEHQVGSLVVGSELLSFEHERQLWGQLIARVRTIFKGQLLYSANWDQINGPDFWDLLDGAGVSAYFELDLQGDEPRVALVKKQWGRYLAQLKDFSRMIGKPVVLTEVGYPSQISAAQKPWDETARNPIDLKITGKP